MRILIFHLNLGDEGGRGFDETVDGFHAALHLLHSPRLDYHTLETEQGQRAGFASQKRHATEGNDFRSV